MSMLRSSISEKMTMSLPSHRQGTMSCTTRSQRKQRGYTLLVGSQLKKLKADMNPCQGHILELKLAAVQALDYPDFWKIFGEGRHEDFDKLLTTKISPFLSS